MPFLEDGARRGGPSDAVAKARAARQARAAGNRVGGPLGDERKREAAIALQQMARQFVAKRHELSLLRSEWDSCHARNGAGALTSGQQLVLTNWFLRFFDPIHDEARVLSLARLLSMGMDQDKAEHMFAYAAICPALALRWTDTLRRLLLAVATFFDSTPTLCAAAIDAAVRTSAAAAEMRKQFSARFGPVLRLCLMLGDPDVWKLVAHLQASPTGPTVSQAVVIMANSACSSAALPLVSSLGTFSRALHSYLDVALLGAAAAVAVRAVQKPQADVHLIAAFAFGILSVPALTSRLAAPSVERLRRNNVVWSLCTESGPLLASLIERSTAMDPDAALCLCGNLLALGFGGRPVQEDARQMLGAARLLEALLSMVVSSGKGGGSSCFHQLRGWSAAPPSVELRPYLQSVQEQLLLLWSPAALRLFYTDELFVAVGTKPPDSKLTGLGTSEVQHLAARAQLVAAAHMAALRALQPLRPSVLARLSYSSHIVPCVWSLLRKLPPRAGAVKSAGASASASGVLERFQSNLAQLHEEPLLPLLTLMLEGVSYLLPVLDDHELFDEKHPMSPQDLAELSSFCNQLAFSLTWDSPITSSAPRGSASEAQKSLRESLLRVLTLLKDRDSRRAFCAPEAWLVQRLPSALLKRELADKKPRARNLLSSMPWTIPFSERVNIFRDLVRREKESLPGEQMLEHVKGLHIKVRRSSILEDGYIQLSTQNAEQLKGTVRVEFVSELGLAEAGIDRYGVFKEFLEEVIARAFDVNRGLFAHTPAQRIYPSTTSMMADPNHIRLFEFVGRMLGKALYEGIVLDLPLADFFVAKLLGKHNSLDELPSLDEQLFASLLMLKRYDGDVENDLCLNFVVDEEAFGERRQVELREMGSTIPVTRDNRIEYVHLMADYRLNKQIAEQSKAVVMGLNEVVPAGWLRLFSTPELQRLIGGDDVAIDVTDLKKHTRYAGGYHEMSPTVRDLWAVLAELSREDLALFLKFVTSCSKPPLLGFQHLNPQFTVQCVSADGGDTPSVLAFFGMGRKETGRLPTSATCFNLLKLPNFKSKKILREKLRDDQTNRTRAACFFGNLVVFEPCVFTSFTQSMPFVRPLGSNSRKLMQAPFGGCARSSALDPRQEAQSVDLVGRQQAEMLSLMLAILCTSGAPHAEMVPPYEPKCVDGGRFRECTCRRCVGTS